MDVWSKSDLENKDNEPLRDVEVYYRRIAKTTAQCFPIIFLTKSCSFIFPVPPRAWWKWGLTLYSLFNINVFKMSASFRRLLTEQSLIEANEKHLK